MQRYENYKLSGIQWVEKIPNQWDVERAKWIFQRMERPIRPEDGVVTAFRDGQVTLRTNRRIEGFTNAIQEHGYQGIRQGDLVIHAMDAFAGAIGVSDSDGKSTPVYAACVPSGEHDVNSYYYAYLLRYMAHSGFIESLSKGIRERSTDFRFAEFRELPLPIPSRAEQDRIVTFLDQKTAEIDAAIAKKERLIELLQEQKSILINQAVTRGLNPDVPMRDSGVEWIGSVPAHWKQLPNRALFRERNESGHADLPILSVSLHSGVSDQEQDETENVRAKIRIEDKTAYKRVHPGDVAYNMMRAWQGAIGVVRVDGLVSPAYVVAAPRSTINGAYFEQLYRTQGFIKEMDRYSKGITDFRKRLYWYEFKQLISILPPMVEQAQIAAYAEKVIYKTSLLCAKIRAEIKQLNEFRAGLIASAVTGQIRT